MIVPSMLSANDLSQASPALEETVQDMEGNTYQTVKIGNQVWLAENLRSTKFQDGSKIKTGFIPKDDEENLLKYGRLYDWHDVADERNICPAGWRVATDDDWKALERSIGMSEEEVHKKGWRGTQGAYTEFWTGSSATDKDAIIRTLAYSWWNAHKGEIRRATSSKDYMFSVRCVKI